MQRIWLELTPIMFLILWPAGYLVAKVVLADAAHMAWLALRFAAVIAIMTVLFAILRPPLPKTPKDWLHHGFISFLMQPVYFGMAYFSFVNGVAAGTAALIFSLQPLLVALLAPRWSGEAVRWPQWLGLAIAMTGTFVVIITRLEIGPPPLGRIRLCRFGLSHQPVTENLVVYSAELLRLLPLINWVVIAAVN
jgi:drug/metabolite transporter (DMT)-like permease